MDLRIEVDKLQAEYALLKIQRKKQNRKAENFNTMMETALKAKTVLIEFEKQVQTQVKTEIERPITTALQSVFNRPYIFTLDYKTTKKGAECRPIVTEDDIELNPQDDEMGGGAIDIMAFALRIVLWSMKTPKSRNLFVLDEPFKFCGELSVKAGDVLKQLAKELKFQVLLVTHDDNLTNICDRVWKMKRPRQRTIVQMISEIKRKIKRRKKGGEI